MRSLSYFNLVIIAAVAAASTAFSQGVGNRMSQTTSRIIRSMATSGPSVSGGFGTATRFQPIAPGGCYPQPPCNLPPCNVWPNRTFPVVAAYGGGWYGSSFDSGLAQENLWLRDRLDRLEAQLRSPADEVQQDGNIPAKDANRLRVERQRAAIAINSGLRLFQKGEYLAAARKFATATKLLDGDAAAGIYLAQSQFAAGNFAEATRSLKNALANNPDWPQAEADIRRMYGDPAELTDQMAALAKHLQDRPLDAEAMFLLAFELFVSGEIDASRQLFEQAARLSPDDSHLKPFFDYFAKRDAVPPPPQPGDRAASDDIPIPDLLLATSEQ